jgi:adenosylcobinamide kinase/adenosylcobinamide-phosphate guanylyltransferase
VAEIILVTGGTRSGKSSFAIELAEKKGNRRLFVATCPKLDEEMQERINRHQKEREGRGWATIECERELAPLFTEKLDGYDVVLIDCVTLWVNNILYTEELQGNVINDLQIRDLCNHWLDAAADFSGAVVCVTNEVGLGIVPDNASARRYRDLVGTCNQTIGARAKQAFLVCCGIPVTIK